MNTAVMTIDHPGWITVATEHPSRLVRTSTGVFAATWTGTQVSLRSLHGSEDQRPAALTVDAAHLPPRTPPQLADQLRQLGTVHRLANPWLWDAITTAILRQVVRAAQARALYQRWCHTHGMSLTDGHGMLALPPGPESVLTLPEPAFTETGTAFHRTALQAAARAYLEHAAAWSILPPAELAAALDAVPRIGPWTARAAAADFTGDFSIYPHGDLAVRTWATRAAPEQPWPARDREFETEWRALADTTHQLHALTLLTLTWGSNARTNAGQPDPSP
jgi:3-methyladenine DNA glycosylase/8-oxoguanine DNA glycosylase